MAKLVGVPDRVVRRAREILEELENGLRPAGPMSPSARLLMTSKFPWATWAARPCWNKLRMTDVNILSPIEALNLLAELKQDLNGD